MEKYSRVMSYEEGKDLLFESEKVLELHKLKADDILAFYNQKKETDVDWVYAKDLYLTRNLILIAEYDREDGKLKSTIIPTKEIEVKEVNVVYDVDIDFLSDFKQFYINDLKLNNSLDEILKKPKESIFYDNYIDFLTSLYGILL